MLEDIRGARRSVKLESYIFAADSIGWQFADALIERARSGVSVQVHLDAAGALFEGTSAVFEPLRAGGVDVKWFNRWRWREPWRFNRRNHRKLLVVDSRCFYVGGFNIHRQSSRASFGERRWRDVQVRLDWHLVDVARATFDEQWTEQSSRPLAPWCGRYRLLPNATRECRHILHCFHVDALAAARRTVRLTTPYFVPDRDFRAALRAAAARGVDVRVMLPALSDSRIVQWASHALARTLSGAGVSFHEYLPRMLHAKTLVVDEEWASVGSANMDYRSFFINRELNLISRSPLLCRQLIEVFEEDLLQARPLDWRDRFRSGSSSRIERIAQAISRRFRRWL